MWESSSASTSVKCAAVVVVVLSCVSRGDTADHAPPKVRRPPDALSGEEIRTVALYREALPSVVMILTSRPVVQAQDVTRESGLGTGVLISADNHILTAAHVVDNADRITVRTQDGVQRPAVLLFSEPDADIALLRLETLDSTLPHGRLGDSDRLAIGQKIHIIGNPRGLENSYSVGHISGFREFNRLYDGTILAEFIQTDAAINSGNSGGPAFDSEGRVIGIASRILTRSGGSEGLGFVVAINTAKQLLALENRAWTGIQGVFLSASQLAELLNLDRAGGLLVQSVAPNSPGERAGLRGGRIPAQVGSQDILLGGDLILQFGQQDACHGDCLVAAHAELAKLAVIPVSFLRGGKLMRTSLDVSSSRKNFLKGAESTR